MKTKFVRCPECGGAGLLGVHSEDFDSAKECSCCNGTGAIEVPMTNADCIRAMSDEELVAFMQEPFCNKRTNAECKGSFSADCDQCILDWLKQPAEVEGEDE